MAKSTLERLRATSQMVQQALTLRRTAHAKQVVFAFHFNDWKRDFLARAYPEYDFVFVPFRHNTRLWRAMVASVPGAALLCWGYNEPAWLASYAAREGLPIWRMEDGFVRSMGLGAEHTRPMSLVLDKTGVLYFDAREPSGLEGILATYDFAADPALTARASRAMRTLRERGVSKYNLPGASSGRVIYDLYARGSGRKRVLVIGQVEDDASIARGAPPGSDNGRLAWEARKRNPDADIFFKPHPDVLYGKRPAVVSLDELANIVHVVKESMSMAAAFESVDEVYTITSLAGFEALLHGKKVVTWGQPFYAGWGLTEDLNPLGRRTRRLALEELFAAAYLLYPRYHNPVTGDTMALEDALEFVDLGVRHREEREAAAHAQALGAVCSPPESQVTEG